MKNPDGHKLAGAPYEDLSDYSRGIAVGIARLLAPTPIRAVHITLFHFLLMILAALCVHAGTLMSAGWAALFIVLKNILDAVDGSLARLQNRPSRVGRFMDSNLDFVGNLVFFVAIPGISLEARLVGFLAFTFQGSIFNFYSVWFRCEEGGDPTSRNVESAESPYPYDNPTVMKWLFAMYRVCYAWQDRGVAVLDRFMAGRDAHHPDVRFMELASVLGPGFQYLAIIVFLVMGIPAAIPDMFIFIFNIYAVVLLLSRSPEN